MKITKSKNGTLKHMLCLSSAMEKLDTIDIDNVYLRWTRNVADKYKDLSTEEIKQDLKANSLPFAVLMMNIIGDLNFGSVIRSANFLGAREVFYYGKKRYDRRGAVGVHNYSSVNHLLDLAQVINLKSRYTFIALENNVERNIIPIQQFIYPQEKEILFLIGEEGCGLSKEILDLCDHFVEISSRGSVRSLNASTAAGIAMYDFVAKYSFKNF